MSGIDWKHCKHPLPEHVYDVYMKYRGEALPFILQRLDRGLPPRVTMLDRPIGAYLRENVCYIFSGFNYTAPFLTLLLEVGVDQILFSTDYPYSSMTEALDRVAAENLLCPCSPFYSASFL